MRVPYLSLLAVLVTGLLSAQTDQSKATTPSILPRSFAGWQVANSQTSANPAAADSTNAALLKEYGFTGFEAASYTRDDGNKLTVKAARFQDASGAYGAFTYYKMPQMLNEKIGDQGYSLNERVLFYRGNVLVDAVFARLTAMSAAELRELADLLPHPGGATANLPGLPAYLPKDSYIKNTARYIMGPVALERTGAPVPAQYVDFSKGAEVVLGDYSLSGVPVRLMLIGYPTPQIAAAQLKQIDAAQQAHKLGDQVMTSRRSGPIVALLRGPVPDSEAKALLSQINYDADVTWNERTPTRRDNVANLIVGVIILAAIIGGISIVAGLAFGGFRLVIKRLFPNRVFDRPEQMEIIALHLSDRVQDQRDSV